MANNDTIIKFMTEEGEAEFKIVEETRLNGVNYLLVYDNIPDSEEEALILKEIKENENGEVTYEIVDDDKTLNALAKIFEELLTDVTFVTDNK